MKINNLHTLWKIEVCAGFFTTYGFHVYVKTVVFGFSLVETRMRFWEILPDLMLNKKDSLAVVKFLLPRVDITGKLKLKDFNSMKKCVVWLAEITWGMTWDEHMVAVAREIGDQ